MNEEKYLLEYDSWIKRCVNVYIARGKNQSAELREDLYQEARLVFVKLLREYKHPPCNRNEFLNFRRGIESWLYRVIAKNRGIGFHYGCFKRDCRNVGTVEFSDELKNTLSIDDEDTTEIEEWILSLPQKQREIVRMRIDGYTFNEIANNIGCTARSARMLMDTKIRSSYKEYFNVV